MNLGFSGHRDKKADYWQIKDIMEFYNPELIIHGGAKTGFDRQIYLVANRLEYKQKIFRPDYNKFFYKVAPLRRNDLIVEKSNLLVVLFDGRQSGGTFYTINKAKEKGIDIVYLNPM